jgi:hypothetical protein
MNETLNIFNAIWPYIAGGAGITVFTQILKRLATLEKSSAIRTLFHTVTVVATGLSYWINKDVSAVMLVLHGAGLSGFANALYPAVKWVDEKIAKIQKALKLVDQDLPEIEKVVNEAETIAASTATTTQTNTVVAAQKTNTAPAAADF